MVVPQSSRKIFEDNEHALVTVTLFNKVVDEFKHHARYSNAAVQKTFLINTVKKALIPLSNTLIFLLPTIREHKFYVKDFVYNEDNIQQEKGQLTKLNQVCFQLLI